MLENSWKNRANPPNPGKPATIKSPSACFNNVTNLSFSRPLNKQTPDQTKSPVSPDTNRAKSAQFQSAGSHGWLPLFSIDPRSLALFRIALGALLLTDLAMRATDLTAMYSDEGMFPRMEILRLSSSIWNWSFHYASGSTSFQGLLFGLAGLLALSLMVGFQTRLATIGSWLMLVSLHNRTPPVLSGADTLLRALLFWAMFLPLGQVWSLDARRKGTKNLHPILSVASAAILLQVAASYFFSAIFKTNPDWLTGRAISGILAHDTFASAHAAFWLKWPALLKISTWGVLASEWLGPLLLLSPFRTEATRLVVIALLSAMHLAIFLWMEVGFFPFISMIGLCLFLPNTFWESRLISRFFQSPETHAATQNVPNHSSGGLAWQGLCALAAVYVLAVNINGLPSHPLAPLHPEKWRPFTMALGLGQRWAMFQAIPSNDGWYVARARLRDGSEIDLLRGGAPLDWNRPAFPSGIYPNDRWRKIFREISYYDEQGFQLLRPAVARFLVRRWDDSNKPEKQVSKFELVFCAESKAGFSKNSAASVVRQRHLRMDLEEM